MKGWHEYIYETNMKGGKTKACRICQYINIWNQKEIRKNENHNLSEKEFCLKSQESCVTPHQIFHSGNHSARGDKLLIWVWGQPRITEIQWVD